MRLWHTYYLGTLRVESEGARFAWKLFKILYWGAPVAHPFWGSLFEREIIQKLRLKIIQNFFADCKSDRTVGGSALRAEIIQNLYKIKQNRRPTGGNYSKIKIKNYSKIFIGVRRWRTLFWESLFEREIIQKIGLKIIQKFFADCKSDRTIGGSALRAEIIQNLYKIKQNRRPTGGNYSKIYFKN